MTFAVDLAIYFHWQFHVPTWSSSKRTGGNSFPVAPPRQKHTEPRRLDWDKWGLATDGVANQNNLSKSSLGHSIK